MNNKINELFRDSNNKGRNIIIRRMNQAHHINNMQKYSYFNCLIRPEADDSWRLVVLRN